MSAVATSLAIDATGVTKAYGKGENRVVALAGADLRVPYGELVMLVGPSGCGKTTLISILAGLLTRDGGSCSRNKHGKIPLTPVAANRFSLTF